MLKHSQMLTDGLIIFSALVSDYEKLDFKNDALAGVRANYFNSRNSIQKDTTEIELDGSKFNLSYYMSSDDVLSWKVTKNNHPYQSVKRSSDGIYSVFFYGDYGVVYKRIYFDKNHTWIRTEYFDRAIENVRVCIIYPEIINSITAICIERFDKDGNKTVKKLFPSRQKTNKTCTALVYSNVGMLWYDESFAPQDLLISTENKSNTDDICGFVFDKEYFKSSYCPENTLDMLSSDYLDNTIFSKDEAVADVDEEKEPEQTVKYSAYEKIGKILNEAHKSNKDLFGELVSQVSENDYAGDKNDNAFADNKDILSADDTVINSDSEIVENTENKAALEADAFESTETTEVPEITESTESVASPDITESTESVASPEITESTESVASPEINENLKAFNENAANANVDFEEISDKPQSEKSVANRSVTVIEAIEEDGSDNDLFEIGETKSCDAVIITKSGRYAYYGELDSQNCRTGRGRTVTPEGITSYEGEYNEDMRSGFGVCYYKNGKINYVGNWNENNRHGSGVGYRLSDGTMHIGKWNNNAPDGYGARFDSNGNFIDVSMYDNGIKNGKSISINASGRIVISMYNNGNKISEKIIDIGD